MNMKSSDKTMKNIENSFNELFEFEDNKDLIDVKAHVLASKFLSEILEVADKKKLNRKQLAEKIGTSASYLTQLFRGNKLINLTTIAKLQEKLDIEFEVTIKNKNKFSTPVNEDNIAEMLDKWYADNKSRRYVKITRNFSRPVESDYGYATKLKNIAS